MYEKSKDKLLYLIKQLTFIRREMLGLEEKLQGKIAGIDPIHRESAVNLIHYLVLRRHDLRSLQSELAELGLSSLGRSESHVLATIDAVILTLYRLAGQERRLSGADKSKIDFVTAKSKLEQHTRALLGPPPSGRKQYIMVTMPSAAAYDYELVINLLKKGMNCMRINCAHDGREVWSKMIENIKRASHESGLDCKIIMDLPGPKLRTGPICPGPEVLRIRPGKNAYGQVIKPATLLLTANYHSGLIHSNSCDAVLSVDGKWLSSLESGDRIKFKDARGSKRYIEVTRKSADGLLAESDKTAYITPHTNLCCPNNSVTKVKNIRPIENYIPLNPGDILELKRDLKPGRPAEYDDSQELISHALIGCTSPEVFDDVKVGEPISFDDGKINGVIEAKHAEGLRIRITNTGHRVGKLKTDKGINLPLTKLCLPALTENDLPVLEYIVENADIVALSFVNSPEDIRKLINQIELIGKGHPSIVLKIETRRGFQNLAAMIVEAMKVPSCGVMIARGDLAVELGFERLAEVQEEILWLCEAAHIPVIWATQVLESLAKQGAPTRAEITDAAMGHRAECVMLNKGRHILDALTALDNILRRMETHQFKKMSMLRELSLAYNFPG